MFKLKTIRSKLSFYSIIGTIFLVSTMSIIGIVSYKEYEEKQLVETTKNHLRSVAYTISAAIDFNDKATAEEALSLFRFVKPILQVKVIKNNGSVFISEDFDRFNNNQTAKIVKVTIPIENDFNKQIATIEGQATTAFLNNQLKQNISDIIIFSFLVLLATSLLVAILSKNFVKPILILQSSAKAIAKGDFSHRVIVNSHDEIEDLAILFNQMTESLRGSTVSKKHLDNIIEAMVDSLIVTSPLGEIKTVNKATCKMLGYLKNKLIGKHINALFPKGSKVSVGTNILDRLIKEGQVENYETLYIKKDGSPIPILLTAAVMRDDDFRIDSIVMVIKDITIRKKDEEERAVLERQLNQSQKLESIGTLAAGIAHEINTPIQFIGDNTHFFDDAVKGLFDLIEHYRQITHCQKQDKECEKLKNAFEKEKEVDLDFFKEEIPKAIEQTKEGVERVSRIVSAMKDFSHMGSEEKEEEDINKAVESTVTISRNEWKYVSELKLDLDKNLPMVRCVVGDIKQVVLNLIVNAAHAIKEKQEKNGKSDEKGLITISTSKEDGFVVIKISDTGAGIPEDIRDKVFDHFFTTKKVGKGTGQGLSMAYTAIVQKHDGDISFESEVGVGTTFIIKIPRK